MKTVLKLISMLLVLVLVMQMLPMQSFAEMLSQSPEATAVYPQITTENQNITTTPLSPDKQLSILGEIPEGRTEYSKEFLLSNGLHMMATYAEPVHYEKNGQWEQIDNTLKAASDGTYQNTAGVWNVSFPQQFGSTQSVVIEKDGYTLSFGMPQKMTSGGNGTAVMSANAETVSIAQAETSTAQVIAKQDVSAAKAEAEFPETILEGLASRMTYENIHTGTDVIYDLTSNQVKESVILESYDSSLRGFQYILNVGAMLPVLDDNGHIEFYDETGKNIVMVMPAPYLVDGAMDISTDIQVSLTGKGSTYILTYSLPQSWLSAEARLWPVILDPVIQADLEVTNVQDCSVAESTTFSYTSPVLETGYYQGEGKQRTYLKYQTLPTLTSSDVVVSAVMTMYKFVTSSSTAPIEVHKVKGDWESESITWANKPDYDETIEDFVICREQRYYSWDVTDIVQEWYATGNNYGMLFKASDAVENAGANNFKQFYSSDYSSYPTYMPNLQIVFRNNNGLESYWNYTSSSAGRAGTGHVNDYTGNLTWIRSDLGFSGNRMPVSVSHIYNANDAAENRFGMGYGWRSNYNQLVYQWSENTAYYVWEDSDGTSHYFYYDSNKSAYVDEDGLELTLTATGTGNSKFILTDKGGNESHFDESGRLTKLQNNQATPSTITITYISADSNLIDTITDGAGRVYDYTYTDGYLTRLSFLGTGTEEITYVTYGYSDGNLVTVTDKDNEFTSYGYTSGHMLTSATDIDGYELQYTYSVEDGLYAPCRVTSIREYHNDVAGGHMTIEYGNNQTVFTDVVNGTKLITQFNNYGNTISVQDDEGRAQYAQFARNDTSDTAGKGNQLTLSSKMQNTVVNLLYDSSFENSTLWTATGATAAVASIGYLGSKSLSLSGTGNVQSAGIAAEAGKTYTFSGYVKTTSGKVQLGISNGISTVCSDAVSASDWTRIQIHYTATADETVYAVFKGLENATAYLDCVQVEKMPTASRYNLVQNGDFATITGWTTSNLATADTISPAPESAPMLSSSAYQITGDYTSSKSISQEITVSGGEGDSFVFGGWAYGNSASLTAFENEVTKDFALKCTITYTDGTTKEETVQYNPDVTQWQFVSRAIAAEKDYSKLTVTAIYSNNANTIWFDGIQVFKEEFGVSYTYDEDGNVISVIDLQKKNTTYEYDENNNLTQIMQDDKVKMTYEYYENSHNVKSATTEEGLKYDFTYDAYGNNTGVSITQGGKTISSSATYTENGNLLSTATDALGNTTTYHYNTDTGLLEWVKLPEDSDATRTEYTYDEMYRVATIAADTETGLNLSANYTYEDDLLKTIETPTNTYSFEYGNFALRSAVKIGGKTLVSYTYEELTNRLKKLDYGNGDSVEYTYDSQGRLLLEIYEDGQTVSYQYDNSGNLATVTDSETGIVTTYYYDLLNRLVGYREKSATLDHAVTYSYDAENNLSSMVEVIDGVTKTYTYTYDEDNRLTSMSVDGTTVTYSYDDFGRISNRTVKNGDTVIESITPGYYGTETTTSGQIVSYNGYSYTYDKNGNILTVSDGTNTTSYVYDSQNQLIRENNQEQGYTHTWTYDNAGNILTRTEYAYTTGELGEVTKTVSYTYNAQKWKDLLRSYDGNYITYDGVGNPTSDGTWVYTWKHGRQLVSMKGDTATWTYTYDANGMRTSRSNGTDTYTYVYNGSQLTAMTKGADTLYFTYDASGTPLSVIYNGTTYYYSTNLQGDILRILDSTGTVVVTYAYDAWGNLLSCTGTMSDTLGTLNPLRYRGYVYDTETELYYLQSRYYNPEWGRFINADEFVATGQGLLGHNMFAYCGNNPVERSDPSGKSWDVALRFLEKWLWGDGSYEIYNYRSAIVKLLSSNDKIHTLVKKAYTEINRSKDHMAGTGEFTLDEDGAGLYLSTQHFSYYIYDVKKEVKEFYYIFFKRTKVRYTAKVIIYDYYNFDNVREWNSFGNIMNNIAYYMHQYGAGKDYMWYAAYVHTTPWENLS